MALVLYRKYRPKTFSEVIGQDHVVQTLKNALEMGLVSHAYLLAGPRGSGKTTVARLLAKSVNCEGLKKSEPCNSCVSCEEINAGRAMNLIEIDAASNRGIDEVRELREGAKFLPGREGKKIFVIDECHQLTKDAANALLKILEEPPDHVMFVLATTELHKMISTIVSRCQRFEFHRIGAKEIAARLVNIAKLEGVRVEPSALELIAAQSAGSVRDAESMLGQAITFGAALGKKQTEASDIRDLLGLVDTQAAAHLTDFLLQKKGAEGVRFANEVLERGRDPYEFTKAMVQYLRQGLLLKMSPDFKDGFIVGLTQEEISRLQEQVGGFSEDALRRIVKLFLDAEARTKYSPVPQLPLELAVVESVQGLSSKAVKQ